MELPGYTTQAQIPLGSIMRMGQQELFISLREALISGMISQVNRSEIIWHINA